MTFYKILSSMGNVPEDLIGKEIVDVYFDEQCGLCVGIGGALLAMQKTPDEEVEDKILRELAQAKNLKDLKQKFKAKGILGKKPLKKFRLTYEMLQITPEQFLECLVEVARLAKEANMGLNWIDVNKIINN